MKFSPVKPRDFNRWDALKLLALGLMFVDHIGYFFFPDQMMYRAVGRSCAPIFMFLAGLAGSYRFKLDILLLAILLTISDWALFFEPNVLNMLFGILIIRAIFDWMEKRGKTITRPMEWYLASVLLCFFTLFIYQYGTLGLLFGVLGYMIKNSAKYTPQSRTAYAITATATYGLIEGLLFDLSNLEFAVMSVALAGVCWLMLQMDKDIERPVALPKPFAPIALFIVRYAAYIYVAHIIVIQWIVYKQL